MPIAAWSLTARLVAQLLVVLVAAAACSATVAIDDSEGGVTATDGGEASGEAFGDGLEVGGDEPRTDSAPMTSAEVYEAVSRSIVFLETTDDATGSGIVIEGGWVLTNAHVVDRLAAVRVGRSDGADLGEFPVFAIDWIFDLALVGPIEDDGLVPLPRVPSSDLAIGERVLLLGFPDESSVDPTPTLTEGIVNRRRQPVVGEFPFVQVDATIAPGQSGGALLDGSGNLVGISGIEFGAGEFALAFEADAMWPRVDRMLASGGTEPLDGIPVFNISGEVGLHRTLGFAIDTDESGHLEVAAASPDDLYIELQSLGGVTVTQQAPFGDVFDNRPEDTIFYVDDLLDGGETLVADIEPGRYQVVIGAFRGGPVPVDVVSPNGLYAFPDVEEGQELPVGEVVEGELDWPRDSDRWTLTLGAGDEVTIVADGLADTILSVRLDGRTIATSDDEGLGVFGTGSRVDFVAEVAGIYEVEIGSFDAARWGYLVEVSVS